MDGQVAVAACIGALSAMIAMAEVQIASKWLKYLVALVVGVLLALLLGLVWSWLLGLLSRA